MVIIEKEKDKIVFDLTGFAEVLSSKKKMSIPIRNVKSAYQNEKYLNAWEGSKVLGTHVPGELRAGTFKRNNMQYFWAAKNIKNTVIIDLADESFEQLILEVSNPAESIDLIDNAIE